MVCNLDREAGFHQKMTLGPYFHRSRPNISKAQKGKKKKKKKEMSDWRRDKALKKSSSPSYPHSPQANAAMALNLTNSFLQLQRPISSAVAPPKHKVLSRFTLLFTPQFSKTLIIHFRSPPIFAQFPGIWS